MDGEANAEPNMLETQHVVSHSVKLKNFAVSLAMSTPASFPFRLEIDQSLVEGMKTSRFLCQLSSDNTLHESCWWFKTLFGVLPLAINAHLRLVLICLLFPSSFSLSGHMQTNTFHSKRGGGSVVD